MAKQSNTSLLGLVEWDLDDGHCDFWVDGVPVIINARFQKSDKYYLSRSHDYIHFSDRTSTSRLKLGLPGFYAHDIYADILAPEVAQIPFFCNSSSFTKDQKHPWDNRLKRMRYLIDSHPEIKNWFIYLTDVQNPVFHKIAKDFGFKSTKTFINPNTDNEITEYSYEA